MNRPMHDQILELKCLRAMVESAELAEHLKANGLPEHNAVLLACNNFVAVLQRKLEDREP